MSSPRPANVGILAMEVYFPSRFVAQVGTSQIMSVLNASRLILFWQKYDKVDLEAADNCAGKYTSGLGQQRLAFVDDREVALKEMPKANRKERVFSTLKAVLPRPPCPHCSPTQPPQHEKSHVENDLSL